MSEARYIRDADRAMLLAAATIGAYEVIQLPNGRAAFLDRNAACATGSRSQDFQESGVVLVEKTTGMVLLAGQDVFWDHSANKAHYLKVNDRDFWIGVAEEDATGADLTVLVNINKHTTYKVDALNSPSLSVAVGTQAVGGFGYPRRVGGAHKLVLSATSEAQKIDLLSVDGFAVGANAIIEGAFRVVSDGAGSAPDFNIGAASGTHATDFDSVAAFVGLHLDGNDTTISAASRDGTSTPVAATDTTADYTEGSAVANRVHFLIDTRDPVDCQIYVNGVLVLSGSVFDIDAATTLFLVAHLEKTSAADVYDIDIDTLRAWTSEQ